MPRRFSLVAFEVPLVRLALTASNAALSHYKRKSLCLPHFDEIVLKSFSESSNSDCC